ncbi:CLIP domain-containing serine protease B4-like [Anopheles marshallii]|uniref:CLIP domain-containing serine protease B4-like n=1 Tax=Anopheles marshallii TaxID=1521116 RepID=UPI00237A9BC8|nr:CLIP domain-containing serine protease B4-like [Anopheles marshallii]
MPFDDASQQRWSYLLLSLVWWTGQFVAGLELGESCVNPAGESGKCILFRDCQPLVNIYNKPINTPQDTEFLTQSRCGMLKRNTLMCCAASSLSALLPTFPHCGMQMSDRVIGGKDTKINEFPWTALIEFRKLDGSFGFGCGGSLINERYIVTAAHCIERIPAGWKVHRVRLGEWDLSTANDCQDGFCSKAPIDLEIEKIVVHSNYDPEDHSYKNDIALIRFTRSVQYSETVRPICLQLSASVRYLDHVGFSSYAAGWGETKIAIASQVKLMVELNVTSWQECASFYEENRILLNTKQMCAGGVYGKDTCSGDSGGPLMRQIAGAWYLIGVISFGSGWCGVPDEPGVYTNVAEYVDWIRNNVY